MRDSKLQKHQDNYSKEIQDLLEIREIDQPLNVNFEEIEDITFETIVEETEAFQRNDAVFYGLKKQAI